MKYLIKWNFDGISRRYWTGFGAGFGNYKKSAKIFGSHGEAAMEVSKVLQWCRKRFGTKVDYGASVRPA